jgi:mannose/fructose/N-acetylgalactosamine-specific phosphotransferase system component IIC
MLGIARSGAAASAAAAAGSASSIITANKTAIAVALIMAVPASLGALVSTWVLVRTTRVATKAAAERAAQDTKLTEIHVLVNDSFSKLTAKFDASQEEVRHLTEQLADSRTTTADLRTERDKPKE